MKPCHKQKPSARRPSRPSQTAARPASSGHAASQPPVHRYVHPIRTARPMPRSSVEELLSDVLEILSRHSDQLDEVLRRLERDNSDTI
ncbi:MAG: hypothetical protein K2O45_06285 [Oscillospiraceae bacterium]|nr:hypothetical protein [Oscillospiraceae bacterium]